jgi:anti-sigma factor RsiW
MSLSHETLMELMSFADGELDAEDRARVESLIASDDEARRVVEAMRGGEVGSWLAGSLEQHAVAAGADRIADGVMSAIANTAPAALSGGIAIPSVRPRGRRSLGWGVGGVLAGGLALAAAVAVYFQVGPQRPEQQAPVASVVAPAVDFQLPVAPSAALAQQGGAAGVEVNEIDAPSRGVSVFEIPVQAAAAVVQPSGPSSIVVWVEDDPGAK